MSIILSYKRCNGLIREITASGNSLRRMDSPRYIFTLAVLRCRLYLTQAVEMFRNRCLGLSRGAKVNSGVILLSGIVLLGALLRLYKIDERCLSGDEVITIDMISASGPGGVWHKVSNNLHCDLPLFYCLLHLWSYVSKSIFWLRGLLALSSVLLIIVAYRLGRYLFDRKIALLAAYFTSISPLLVLYSQSMRYYSLNSLFSLLSMYTFIKALHNNRASSWLNYILVTAVRFYLNYSSFLILFAQGLFTLFYRRKYRQSSGRWCICLSLIILLSFPVLLSLIRDFSALFKGEYFVRVPLKAGWISNLLYSFFCFSLGKTVSPFNYPVVIAAAVLYGAILIKFFKVYTASRPDYREAVVFTGLSLALITGLCAFSAYNSPRYIKSASVLYAMIISLGIWSFPRKTAVIFIVLISALRFYSLYNLYNERQYHRMELKDSWDEITAYADEVSCDDDVVVYNSTALSFYLKEKGIANAYKLPEEEEGMTAFITGRLKHQGISNIIFIDSPLSGNRIDDYAPQIILLRQWLDKNGFKLAAVRPFDRDEEARLKRKFVNRSFPEYRSTAYRYSKK